MTTLTVILGGLVVFLVLKLWKAGQHSRNLSQNVWREVAKRVEVEHQYQLLLCNLPNTTVCLFDREFRHVVANGTLVNSPISGESSSEGERKTLTQVFHKDLAKTLAPYYKAVFEGQACNTEQHFRSRTYQITLLPLRVEGESIEMGMAVLVDITDERAMVLALQDRTQDLERSNRDLEQFANVASHELKSPLRRIASFADLLSAEYGDLLSEEGREYTQHIRNGVESLGQVIESLLVYSRVQPEATLDLVDIGELLREIVRSMAVSLIHERHARVVMAPMPRIWGDRTLLRQLFENLIANAIKFNTTGRRPIVRIYARRDLMEWEFRVTDNGPGIDPQLRDKVFVMFQRFQPEIDGSGIGLALCKKIVGIHRGKIWFESTGDFGTTFVFTIPGHSGE